MRPNWHTEDVHYPLNNLAEDFDDEVYVPLKYQGVTFHNYKISKYGTVIGPRGTKLKWQVRSKTTPYPCIGASTLNKAEITIPEENWTATQWARKINIAIHNAVAESFLDFTEDNLPDCLKGYNLDEKALTYIRSLMTVDHIDNDTGNPHVDNLRYITPRENAPSNKEKLLARDREET